MLLWWLNTAQAELPLPLFPECGEPDRPDLCPNDFDEPWNLISYVKANARAGVRPEEAALGSGLGADRAWRVTTGRWDVLLAAADSGVDWADPDQVNKFALNVDELPLPQDAGGATAATYDLDGNGLVNVQDYAQDPRVSWSAGRDSADGLIDPSDLLAAFSDGVDDDSNGYTDDIAGWDFFQNDNDAYADLRTDYGTHGDASVLGPAAETGNGGFDGTGDTGVCPNCSVLPTRLGSSFVVDGARVAEAIAYAADRGAVSINLAVGALSDPEIVGRALAYAWDRGLLPVGAAGDENAYHRNFPAVHHQFLFVHSIRASDANEDGAPYSFMNSWNCNNFGPRIDLVAPENACATGAVAMTTGVVGLVVSAARDRGLELTPGEVKQILLQTVDDVALTESEIETAHTYPSHEGWDPFFGYGRVDAQHAVEAVAALAIPPEAELRSPEWFAYLDPRSTPLLSVEGRVAAERSTGFTWTLSWGAGLDPSTWTEVATGQGSEPQEGVLAELDLAALPRVEVPAGAADEDLLERVDRVHEPLVTLLLEVEDEDGRRSQSRLSFNLHQDDDSLPGFPMALGSSLESSPLLVDLDLDGVYEIIQATTGGQLFALRGDGSAVEGFPLQLPSNPVPRTGAPAFDDGAFPRGITDYILASPAAGDLDQDGSPELVVGTGLGGLYVFHADGTPAEGFPVWTLGHDPSELDGDDEWDRAIAGAPTLVDLDGDGTLEILASAMDGRLYVVDFTGTAWGPYPKEICHPENCGTKGSGIVASPSVGDIDGDGDIDIALGTTETSHDGRYSVTHVFDAATGEALAGWPLEEAGLVNEAALLPTIGTGHPASVALADLDHDGRLEVMTPIMIGQTDVRTWDGSVFLDLPYTEDQFGALARTSAPSLAQMINNPAWGDLDQDGTPDLVMGGAGALYLASLFLTTYLDYQNAVGAWSGASGAMVEGFPQQIEDLQFLMAPAIADLTGDGRPEVVYASAGGLVGAWDASGTAAPGFPKFTGQWMLASPAVGDVTGDGYLDVVLGSREGTLFAWSTQGGADVVREWAGIHHDPHNTGNYEVPLELQAGPARARLRGCCVDGATDAAWLALLPFGWAVRRRRGRGDS